MLVLLQARRYIEEASHVSRPIPEESAGLACTCVKIDGVNCDKDGRTVIVENNYWAGKVGKIKFASHPCLGQCNMTRPEGSTNVGHWEFSRATQNSHCLQSRSGVLCRECNYSYSETPSGTVIMQMSGARFAYYLHVPCCPMCRRVNPASPVGR